MYSHSRAARKAYKARQRAKPSKPKRVEFDPRHQSFADAYLAVGNHGVIVVTGGIPLLGGNR